MSSISRRLQRVDRLCSLLGIQHPILLAPMAGVCTPQLAAEVTVAGGLGALGFGSILSSDADDATNRAKGIDLIRSTQTLIKNTPSAKASLFQVGFFCHRSKEADRHAEEEWISHLQPLFSAYGFEPKTPLKSLYSSFLDSDVGLEMILEARPHAASFHFGLPHPHQLRRLKAEGIVTLATATSIGEAILIAEWGKHLDTHIDIIVAQGIEAGGHRGVFDEGQADPAVTTVDLVKQISTHPKTRHLPVVAAGGVMDGADAAQMILNGASGVQMGTAFVQCGSSAADAEYKRRLMDANATTQFTASVSGRPARGLLNLWGTTVDVPRAPAICTQEGEEIPQPRPRVPPYPFAYHLGKQLHEAASKGPKREFGFGAHWAGSNVRKIRPMEAGSLVAAVADELERALTDHI